MPPGLQAFLPPRAQLLEEPRGGVRAACPSGSHSSLPHLQAAQGDNEVIFLRNVHLEDSPSTSQRLIKLGRQAQGSGGGGGRRERWGRGGPPGRGAAGLLPRVIYACDPASQAAASASAPATEKPRCQTGPPPPQQLSPPGLPGESSSPAPGKRGHLVYVSGRPPA